MYAFKEVRTFKKQYRFKIYEEMERMGFELYLVHHICYRKDVKFRRYLDDMAEEAYKKFIDKKLSMITEAYKSY